MKKIPVIMTIILLFTFFTRAEKFRLGVSSGYYSIQNSIYKETYGSGNFMYGTFLGYNLTKRLELRGESGYFKDRGKTGLTKEEMEFSIIPVVAGIRYLIIKIKFLNPYIGAGVDFYFFKEKVRLGDTSDSTTGFHIETGSYISLGRRLFIELNFRYVNAKVKPYDETINLGGFRTGIGVGFFF